MASLPALVCVRPSVSLIVWLCVCVSLPVCALQLQQLVLHFAVCTMRLHLNPQRIDSVSFWPALDSQLSSGDSNDS